MNGKIISEKPRNTLKKQYESVFSTPLPEKIIYDNQEFFSSHNYCIKCENEVVHICTMDSRSSDQNLASNTNTLYDIFIN